MKKQAALRENQPESRDPLLLAGKLFEYLDEKKARDILVMNLEDINPYFQYFMIASATSSVHLKTLVKDIQKQFASFIPRGFGTIRSEDLDSGWVIVDFVDLVLHLFLEEQRRYYRLERLWGDARRVPMEQKKHAPS